MALTKKQQALEGFTPTPQSTPLTAPNSPDYTTAVRPVASPVNVFAPAVQQVVQTAPESPLMQLAGSLRGFDNGLDRFLSARMDQQERQKAEQDRKQRVKAVEDFYKREPMSTADAVRKGLIPPDASPAYMEASREQEGSVKGRQLVSEIDDSYNQWDGRQTASPQEFTKWYSDQVRSKVQGIDDVKVLEGMLPHIEKSRLILAETHSKERSAAVTQTTLDNASAEVNQILDDNLKSDPTGTKFDAKAVAANIENVSTKLSAVGVRGADLNKVVVDVVTQRAVDTNNPDLLDVLIQRRQDGTRGAGETRYGRQEIAQARDKIFSQAVRLDNLTHAREERSRKESAGIATRKVIDILAKDPTADIPPEVVEFGKAADPEFVEKIEKLRGTFATGQGREDPQRAREAEIRIYKSETPFDTAVQEIEAGNIKNPISAGRLLDRTSAIQRSRGRGEASILRMPVVNRYRDLIERTLVGPDDPLNIDGYTQSNYATSDMEARLAEWEAKNPGASAGERIQAAERIGQEVFGAIDNDLHYNREQTRQLPKAQAEPKNQTIEPGSEPTDALPPGEQHGEAQPSKTDDPTNIIEARIAALSSMGGKLVGKVKVGKPTPEIDKAITTAAKKYGVDRDALLGTAWLESAFDPKADNGKARGLFQFIDGTAKQYQLNDPFHVGQSADAAARLMKDNGEALQGVLGRKPSKGELYLAHQQGAGGAAILLRQPRMKAVDALAKLNGVSRAEALSRIKSNLPANLQGRAEDITAGEFAKLWTSKLDG